MPTERSYIQSRWFIWLHGLEGQAAWRMALSHPLVTKKKLFNEQFFLHKIKLKTLFFLTITHITVMSILNVKILHKVFNDHSARVTKTRNIIYNNLTK